jgi:hypothetical protein
VQEPEPCDPAPEPEPCDPVSEQPDLRVEEEQRPLYVLLAVSSRQQPEPGQRGIERSKSIFLNVELIETI